VPQRPAADAAFTDTGRMRQRLNASQVAELAELLEDAPRGTGVVEQVLQAAAEGRGMTLTLADPSGGRRPDRANAARPNPVVLEGISGEQ
jgi:hypothetical protein